MKNKKLFILFVAADFIVFAVVACVVVMKTKHPAEKPTAPTQMQNQTTPARAENEKEAKVFYYNRSMNKLIPQKISLSSPAPEGKERIQFCAKRLLEGPPEKSPFVATFPKDVSIKNLSIRNGTAIVDFNKNFLKPYGATQEIGMVGSLVLTLTEIPGVKNVQILCEGKKVPYLPEGTEIGHPLERNDFADELAKNP